MPSEPTAAHGPTTGSGADGRLRVALDATPLLGQPTGIGVFCAGALAGLSERADVDLRAFAVSWRRRRGIEGLVPAGVEVRQRPMPARPLHRAWGAVDAPPIEWFIGPVDVVHGTNFVVPPTRRAAMVVSVHDLTPLHHPELCNAATLAYPDLIRRAVRRGAFVHTDSRFVADEVTEAFAVDPERVRVAYPGTPAVAGVGPGPGGPSEPVRRLLPAGAERYVLAVGTAEPRKDLPGLVRAFDVVAAGDATVALVLAGPGGWGDEELARAVAASPARARIVRTGWVDEETLGSLLRAAVVLAYPSVYEGFGFPPLQAMSVGVPVVATCAGSLPEVLGPAAELVAVRDHEALAGALGRLLRDEGRRADLAERGRAQAARYTWAGCAESLVHLYRAAAAAHGRAGAAAGPRRAP